jgi:hypothetical protein
MVLLPVPPATEMATELGYWRLSVSVVFSTADPDRTINCSTLRPFSGRPTICSCATTVPRLTLRVSTRLESACTRTVSESAPTFMLTFTERESPTTSTMPVCSKLAKPLSLVVSL